MINIPTGRVAGTPLLAPIKAHRTFETVIERIVAAIDAHGLQEGDRLPNENEMAQAMEISRPTLRQALRILENVGVIRMKAGQSGGVFISSEMIPVEILGHHIAHEVNHVAELIATRRLLEPLVYHLAAENATEEELVRIGDTITLMETHINHPQMIQRADGMFHRRIAHAAKNRILLQTMTDIYRELTPLRGALTKSVERARHMIEIHTRLLDAIRARDHQQLEQQLQETFIDLEVEFNVESQFSVHWQKKAGNR